MVFYCHVVYFLAFFGTKFSAIFSAKFRFRMECEFRVHRCAVYPENPSAVQVMRYDTENARLAVARQNGAIEIWCQYERRCWDQQGYIPPDEDRPIDVLEWTKNGFLLSAGINGEITQYCPKLYTVLKFFLNF